MTSRYNWKTVGLLALVGVSLWTLRGAHGVGELTSQDFVAADNKNIQYTGRIDFTNPKKPKFWTPGCYIQAKFRGTYCSIEMNDEVLWGNSHNYLDIVVDNQAPKRVQTTGPTNVIPVAVGLPDGEHTVTLCKDTEAGIGSLEFVGFHCAGLVPMPKKPKRKIEFIGDSITCGASSDLSSVPCGKGQWYDQNNAYLSYGAVTARALNAQYHLTSVSGIGLAHSCCNMKTTMPDVFDRINLNAQGAVWDVARYQPDVVTVCLGQNDGPQNPEAFRVAYVEFIHRLRRAYPQAQIVCLTSPMGDTNLTTVMQANLTSVVSDINKAGDKNVHAFFFARSYHGGCGGHPDVAAHQLIANELSDYLKTTLGW